METVSVAPTPLSALPVSVKTAFAKIRSWADTARPKVDSARAWMDKAATMVKSFESGLGGSVLRMLPILDPIANAIGFVAQAADAVVDVADTGIDALVDVIDALDPNAPAPVLPQAVVGAP